MPNFATLDGLSYRTPDGRSLFENLTLAFGAERTGLVGRNGVGKSTLIRLILGEVAPAAGGVAVRGRMGVLRQALSPPQGLSVADLLGVSEVTVRTTRSRALARLRERLTAMETDDQRPTGVTRIRTAPSGWPRPVAADTVPSPRISA